MWRIGGWRWHRRIGAGGVAAWLFIGGAAMWPGGIS